MDYHTPLAIPDLRAASVPEPWTFGVADRTRFGELDALGHVNNTAYLRWLENFRIHYFRAYGIHSYTGAPFPRIVLRRVEVDFLAELGLHTDYIVCGRTVRMRSSSWSMAYAIYADGILRATGGAVLVNLNDDNSKQPLPAAWRDVFTTRDGAEQL